MDTLVSSAVPSCRCQRIAVLLLRGLGLTWHIVNSPLIFKIFIQQANYFLPNFLLLNPLRHSGDCTLQISCYVSVSACVAANNCMFSDLLVLFLCYKSHHIKLSLAIICVKSTSVCFLCSMCGFINTYLWVFYIM